MRWLSGVWLISLFFTSGCGSEDVDGIRGAEWGMTLPEVIAVEEQSGNNDYEEIEFDSIGIKMDTLSYENITVDGFAGKITYTFQDEIEGKLLIDSHDFYPKSFFEEINELNKKNLPSDKDAKERQKIFRKYGDENKKHEKAVEENEIIHLNDRILWRAYYDFTDTSKEDYETLRESLVKKYGKPNESSKVTDNWYLDSTDIYITYREDDNSTIVSYSANYEAIEDKMIKNSDNGSSNDL